MAKRPVSAGEVQSLLRALYDNRAHLVKMPDGNVRIAAGAAPSGVRVKVVENSAWADLAPGLAGRKPE